MYNMKVCSKCKIELNHDCFNVDKTKLDGLRPDCKKCRKKVTQNYISTIEFKERKKELNRLYRLAHSIV